MDNDIVKALQTALGAAGNEDLRGGYDIFCGDKDEQNHLNAEIARAIRAGRPYQFKGLGSIRKNGDYIEFVPDKSLKKLLSLAEKYPEPIVPVNAETKKLWGIDTIGDGGLHLDGWTGSYLQYYDIADGKFVEINYEGGTTVSDEFDDRKKFLAPGAKVFHKERSRKCLLICPDEPWSIRKAVFKNPEDLEYFNRFITGTDNTFETVSRSVFDDAYNALLDIMKEDSDADVLFIHKIGCLLDDESKLIRFYWDYEPVNRW